MLRFMACWSDRTDEGGTVPEQRRIEQRTSSVPGTSGSRFERGHRVRLVGTRQWGRVAGGLGDLVAVDFSDGDRLLVTEGSLEHLD